MVRFSKYKDEFERRKEELRMADEPTSVGESYRECGDILISIFISNPNFELSLIHDPSYLTGIPFMENSVPQLFAYIQRELIKKNLIVVTYPVLEFPDITDSYHAILKDVKMKVVPI